MQTQKESRLFLQKLLQNPPMLPFDPKLLPLLFAVTQEGSNASMKTVVALIEQSPRLATRVLAVANSAAYGLEFKVSTLQRAINIMGLREVRLLVLMVGMSSFIREAQLPKEFDTNKFWKHLLSVATIARALAMNPTILLCDEATSALDPTTTKSILALLKDINEKYGITIVIITHSMEVVQEICTHVAIIDAGELAENGTVADVFASPKSRAAKKLVFQGDQKVAIMKSRRCIRIVFTKNSSFEPVIANMVLECRASVNILMADTQDIGGIATGQMILQLPEENQTADKESHHVPSRPRCARTRAEQPARASSHPCCYPRTARRR